MNSFLLCFHWFEKEMKLWKILLRKSAVNKLQLRWESNRTAFKKVSGFNQGTMERPSQWMCIKDSNEVQGYSD